MLEKIIARLEALRKSAESSDMEKASLLHTVKDQKLWKERYSTFADFVIACGYSRSYAYDMLKVYDCDATRVAYQDIGALSAVTIARASKKLNTATIETLVQIAKDHKSPRVKRETKKALEALTTMLLTDVKPEPSPLKAAMLEQSHILQLKANLEVQLASCNRRLIELDAIIMELSK